MESGTAPDRRAQQAAGVSPELLRAWERRYGLLQPTRSAGGLRLYSLDDLERVRGMQQHLAEGLAAAEAAALAAESPDEPPRIGVRRELRRGAISARRSRRSTSRTPRPCSTRCSA